MNLMKAIMKYIYHIEGGDTKNTYQDSVYEFQNKHKEGKMKKVTYCLMVLFMTLMVSASTLEAATEITSLPYTITAQGSYIIKQNLKANWHSIKVQANNVTIDLNGYSIVGNNTSGGHGVYMNGCSNVEIRNGTIRNFGGNGIYEESISGHSHRVINVRVMNNKGDGISLHGNSHRFRECTVSNNGSSGILAGHGSTISGNTACDNGSYGIYTDYGCTVSGNTASGSGNSGIRALNGSTIKNNTAYYNQDYGIYLSAYNLVDGNTAYDNNQSGGTSINMSICGTCILGVNSAP
jgi:parallel beta-helix repeat protein